MQVALSDDAGADLVPRGRWVLDPERTRLGFSIKHLMVTTIHGVFTSFEGVLETGEDGAFQASGSVETASIDTGDAKRDENLCAAGFLDAAAHPRISFESSGVERAARAAFTVVGTLTIKGVTREIRLVAERQTGGRDDELHVTGKGQLSREQFGIAWRERFEAADALVSDRVTIDLDIVAVAA